MLCCGGGIRRSGLISSGVGICCGCFGRLLRAGDEGKHSVESTGLRNTHRKNVASTKRTPEFTPRFSSSFSPRLWTKKQHHTTVEADIPMCRPPPPIALGEEDRNCDSALSRVRSVRPLD